MYETLTFYREWLKLDKKDFRILAMLVNENGYTGSLRQLCEIFNLSKQSRHVNSFKASIKTLEKGGYIIVKTQGTTYQLSIIQQEDEIKISSRWVRDVIYKSSFSLSVSWEQLLKLLLWVYGQAKEELTTNAKICEDLNMSESTLGNAKKVLETEFGSIQHTIEKKEIVFLHNGITVKEKVNVGQYIHGALDWSE